ncbi:2-hydroxy-3-oxopropionate reductase [Terribacillus aidingensis]|uniref:2-hydroxy-3-oxopropionate reductase n=1 Tax=Terribacillus aidingensis TaxID=586416 RepID=A0A285MZF1_9BACI|nr:2-hydroxy-3-oxopropionate reductase [Terribacillus aidingensis]SNZ02574.1 2-hydroxy-3-oxopropionate reductase [Terribacillus aidingensis]
MKSSIGFIGLGIMGKPMALNLIRAGQNVTAFDINKAAVEQVKEAGAKSAFSIQEAAENNEVIITMLPSAKHVKEVLFGTDGVAAFAKPGTIVIDMSSLSPVDSVDIANELRKKDIHMMDAPVSGGEPKAIDGTLSIMVGGGESEFAATKHIFDILGSETVLVGDSGSGATAKLANQIIVNLNIAAMSEALVLAAKADIDIEKMYQAIRGGLAGSTVLDAKVPMILDRNFKPGGRIDINLKDITNVMDTAHSIGVPLPLTSQLLEIFHALKADGKATDDHGGIVQYYEKLAHVEVGRK